MTRLQGTDGVRGRIIPETPEMTGDSIGLFREKGLITPRFVFRYVKGFCRYLKEQKLAHGGDAVVLAWDPRDRQGVLIGAALGGIHAAGLEALIAGCCPTPAAALFMLHKRAAGTIMITASHNPADYNGVKVFLPGLALKPYPDDDETISRFVMQEPDPDASALTAFHDFRFMNGEVLPFYRDTVTSPRNSWFTRSGDGSGRITLVADAAHGAMSPMLEPLFAQRGDVDLVPVNADFTAPINSQGGVVTIEDIDVITHRDFSEGHGKYGCHRGLKTVFDLVKQVPRESRLCGVSFDGDGDRFLFYRYDWRQESLRISDGDACSQLLVSRLLKDTRAEKIHYVTTIESSLAALTWFQQSGIRVHLAAVGDKWLVWNLWKILFTEMGKGETSPGESSFSPPRCGTLQMLAEKSMSGKKNSPSNLVRRLDQQEMVLFGSEPSGHIVSPLLVEDITGDTRLGNPWR